MRIKRVGLNNALKAGDRVLVTGAAGFIGSHLVDSLIADGIKVYAMDSFINGKQENVNRAVEFFPGSIQAVDLYSLPENPSVIFHLAAVGSVPRSIAEPRLAHENNVSAFFDILEYAARLPNQPKVIFASSSSIYGDIPSEVKIEYRTGSALSPYAATKQIDEVYANVFARSYGLYCVALRLFNVFGPRQRFDSEYAAVIPTWISAMLDNRPVRIAGGWDRGRDFTPVSEVVKAFRVAADAELVRRYEAFNIGCGQMITLETVFAMLRELTGSKCQPVFMSERPGDVRSSIADTTRAQRLLDFRASCTPTQLKRHLRETVKWVKSEKDRMREMGLRETYQ